MSDQDRQHTRHAAIFAGGTMFSRVLGLVRDVVLTVIPVPSREAFFIAFKFPNMLREVIGEGAVNAAFVPVLSETIEKESEEKFRELVAAAFGTMIVLLTILTVGGVLVLPIALESGVGLLALVSDQEPVSEEMTTLRMHLVQWVFPYLFFIGLAVFMMAPLFTLKHYVTPSWAPALLNLALITACLGFRDLFVEPAYALVFGIWLGGLAQLIVQYIAMGRLSGVWRPRFRLMHPGVGRMAWLLGPVIVGQAAGEVNKLVDVMFAMGLPNGTVNALWYANRLVQLPAAVFGVATAVAILPYVSRAGAREDDEAIKLTLLYALRQTYFLVFPAMVGLIVLRRPLVTLLFGWNANSPEDIDQTATALLYYAFGLLSFAWIKVLVSGFYAEQRTAIPVMIASFSMLFNILLNFVLVGPLGYRGLALSTTIAFSLNMVLLYAFLCKRFGLLMSRETGKGLLKMTAATGVMAAVAVGSRAFAVSAMPGDGLVERVVTTLGPVIVAALAYGVAAYFLGLKESVELVGRIGRRIRGAKG